MALHIPTFIPYHKYTIMYDSYANFRGGIIVAPFTVVFKKFSIVLKKNASLAELF
jgi:hypothetical protein